MRNDNCAPERPDVELARAARLGDEDAFEQIVDRHGPAMYRFARRLLLHDANAQDVVQDAFVSAWKDLPSYAGRSSLRTWLFRLTARRAADLQRRRTPTPVDDDVLSTLLPAAAGSPQQAALDRELVTALRRALAELPWRQRAIWLLREIDGLSYRDIAEALAIPEDSVRGQLYRGRRALAERMNSWR
ncbi:RNA polymerase sigma factor [Flexivirga meconopsidis]|uniref:RNA polymerase sigma factor n=1 Tax=Flexivirga meconopsidis TaxID=2977121 RepID=UPI00223F689F